MAFTYKPRGVCSQAIEKLEGIKCGPRPTSCPDQLALALREALEKANTP